MQHDNAEQVETVAAADTFQLFLDAVLDAIERDDVAFFRERLLHDARFVAELRESICST